VVNVLLQRFRSYAAVKNKGFIKGMLIGYVKYNENKTYNANAIFEIRELGQEGGGLKLRVTKVTKVIR
jgi:hypothetical protein